MLFLNAGVSPGGAWGLLHETDDKDVEAVVNVNALHVIYFAKAIIG